MNFSQLTVLSPLDGRYYSRVQALRSYFSEFALIQMRIKIELEWLKALSSEPSISEIAKFSPETFEQLDATVNNFSEEDAAQIKEIEGRTNHDVKAIEYWLRERFANNAEVMASAHFIHFSCTSEDINNLAYGLLLKNARTKLLVPALAQVFNKVRQLAHEFADLPMLSRTHGQPATPTTMGKEFANIAYRIMRQMEVLLNVKIMGKMNGAVGNYSAHLAAYPEFDWETFNGEFVNNLGLKFNPYTTQIEPHDYMAELFDVFARINTILISFNRDVWGYISLGYFKQKVKEGEIGSSTMPHKVNPIDFENSEGNLGMANAIFQHFSQKLPISRWQRDLTDSTVLRNLGIALGHTLLGYDSCFKGLSKLEANPQKMEEDLDKNWEILTEAIQTVMRRHGIGESYEELKLLTRGKTGITREELHQFINSSNLPDEAKKSLLALTPAAYLGKATELAKRI